MIILHCNCVLHFGYKYRTGKHHRMTVTEGTHEVTKLNSHQVSGLLKSTELTVTKLTNQPINQAPYQLHGAESLRS